MENDSGNDSESEESKTLLGSEWLKSQLNSNLQDASDSKFDISNDQAPAINIHHMYDMKNKFENKGKKDKKNKNKSKNKEKLQKQMQEELLAKRQKEAAQKKQQQIIKMAQRAKPVDRQDDYRIHDSHPDGGFALVDQEVISKLRNIAKEVIKRVGSQLLRGNMNLTSVSFPIK